MKANWLFTNTQRNSKPNEQPREVVRRSNRSTAAHCFLLPLLTTILTLVMVTSIYPRGPSPDITAFKLDLPLHYLKFMSLRAYWLH